MVDINRQHTAPLKVPRSKRGHPLAVLTSLPAGKMVPLAAIPMLREDSLRGTMRISLEMLETMELLMNPVNCRITAYCVPLLALERFQGSRDQFDRSYKGEPQIDAGSVIPFIETHAMGAHGSNAVYKALGLHAKTTDEVNTAYLEAYNLIWNFRAKNRSADLTPRARLADTLAPAFWMHGRFQHVVPDFDQAVIDGEIALNLVDINLTGSAPLTGVGTVRPTGGSATAPLRLHEENDAAAYGHLQNVSGQTLSSGNPTQNVQIGWVAGSVAASAKYVYKDGLDVTPGTLAADLSAVVAELAGSGVTVSLSNIELARRTQAFAKMREQYEGIDEEWIIDLLMDGLTIPDQALKQPILLADQVVRFGQAKRYATDAANLAESAVSGGAVAQVNLRVPKLNTGGVVMVMAECLPEQLFERQRDPFFHSANVTAWPEFLRDTLDPEKVDVVQNAEIDTDHATPTGTFGYAPMNWKWQAFGPRVGGKFYRPTTNTTEDVERARIWAVETVNPALAADFYIVTTMHQKPFLDLVADPFEAVVEGGCIIEGNTVFGGVLVETSANYDAVEAKAPTDRIVKA